MFFKKKIEAIKESDSPPGFFKKIHIIDVNPAGGTKKKRIVYKPDYTMRLIHKTLINYLRRLSVDLSFAFGGVKLKSLIKHILVHAGKRYIYLIDIKSAYLNVDAKKLARVISDLDDGVKEKDVHEFLTMCCVLPEGGLITGGPASVDLFNIYTSVLIDEKMKPLIKKHGLTYSRYIDDLVFSSNRPIGKEKRKQLRAVVMATGFKINHQKSGVYDLRKGPAVINGIGLKYGGRYFIPRYYLRMIWKQIYLLRQKGMGSIHKIDGMMGYFSHGSGKNARVGFQPEPEFNKTELDMLNEYGVLRIIPRTIPKK